MTRADKSAMLKVYSVTGVFSYQMLSEEETREKREIR
jgi:hypothetical protein